MSGPWIAFFALLVFLLWGAWLQMQELERRIAALEADAKSRENR